MDSEPRESNAHNYRTREWLKTALCPHCGEENTATHTMRIEMNDDGTAVCNQCAFAWKPTL